MASSNGISSDIPDDFKTEDNHKSSASGNIQTDQCEINKTDDDLYKNLKDIVPGFQICEEVFSSSHNYLEERCDHIKNKLDKCKEILKGHKSSKTQVKHINVLISEVTSCRENISILRNTHMSLRKDFENCLLFVKSAGGSLIKHYKHMNSLLVRCKELVNGKRQYLKVDILQMVCKELSECQNILWQRMEEEVATVATITDQPKIEEDQSKLETLNQQLKTITENFEILKRQHKTDQMKYKELSDKFNSTIKELEECSKKTHPEPDIDTQDDLKSQLAKTQDELNYMVKQHQILFEKNNNLIAHNKRLTDELEELKQSLQEKHEINFAHKKQSMYDGKIGIEINDLILQLHSDAMLNPHIKGFYIIYEFLGHRGAQMETPETINIKDAVDGIFTFNFRKEFSVDPVTHPEQRFLLTNMFHSTEEDLCKIHFIVVGEHFDENLPGYKWTDVGYAELDMMTLITFAGDCTVVNLSVFSFIEGDNIGTLRITVDGINVIKYVANNETIGSK